jgi:Na+-transporting methylmalonyl-CoA/oxaloacetate decarboxylase gamma subunit
MSPIVSALWITLIGMGLVFTALLLLWGLMEIMMRLTAKAAAAESAGTGEESAEEAEQPISGEIAAAPDLKLKAAAAAVAVALANAPKGGRLLKNGHPTEAVSAWQSVLRATQLNKRSVMYSRKQRGTIR